MALEHRYGTVDLDYVTTWFTAQERGPMWALNLMSYRPNALYADGRPSTLTGQEADDLYAPEGPLAAIGAHVALLAPVTAQLVGDGTTWDRVAIAVYPQRTAMLAMQELPDFQELHVHKDAGMAFTIVTATFPELDVVPPLAKPGTRLLLQLVADGDAPQAPETKDAQPLGRFSVEGVVIGDQRRWAQARWYVVEADVAAGLSQKSPRSSEVEYLLLLQPEQDHMAELLTAAADA